MKLLLICISPSYYLKCTMQKVPKYNVVNMKLWNLILFKFCEREIIWKQSHTGFVILNTQMNSKCALRPTEPVYVFGKWLVPTQSLFGIRKWNTNEDYVIWIWNFFESKFEQRKFMKIEKNIWAFSSLMFFKNFILWMLYRTFLIVCNIVDGFRFLLIFLIHSICIDLRGLFQ